MLQVEQTLKALGEELDEEGHDVQHYIALFKKGAFTS